MTLSTRISQSLSRSEALRLRGAAVFAFCDGKLLNRFVSIHLDQIGSPSAQRTLVSFLKRAGDCLRKRSGLTPAYVWVLENPLGGGLHAHVLIHVPAHLRRDFDRLMGGWLVGKGNDVPAGAIHARAVRHSASGAPAELYLRHGLLATLRYMLKGIAADEADAFGVVPEAQGVAKGKRSGYSEALGVQHRWSRIPVGRLAWVGGPDVKMKRWVRHHCPELLGLAD